MPSYAATQSFTKMQPAFKDDSDKEATLNPTNPRDRVVEWEADVVPKLRDHAEMKEMVGERSTPSGQLLFLARPIRIKDARCLACHSVPSAASASMRAMYGDSNGFDDTGSGHAAAWRAAGVAALSGNPAGVPGPDALLERRRARLEQACAHLLRAETT